ncbi:Uncharacterised protein [Bordetella pertussis]|nr:Uncharacterised protein [Bordetella pertussis]
MRRGGVSKPRPKCGAALAASFCGTVASRSVVLTMYGTAAKCGTLKCSPSVTPARSSDWFTCP